MFQSVLGMAIVLEDYDNLQDNATSMLEEEARDQPARDPKQAAHKRLRKSSFYLKKMSKEEVTTLLESLLGLMSDYYTRLLTEQTSTGSSRDVFERIMVYTELLIASETLSYRGIDAKTLEKKAKVSSLQGSSEQSYKSSLYNEYEKVVLNLRSRLLADIIAKVQQSDGGNGARANDSFKVFYIKTSLYVLKGVDSRTTFGLKATEIARSHYTQQETTSEQQLVNIAENSEITKTTQLANSLIENSETGVLVDTDEIEKDASLHETDKQPSGEDTEPTPTSFMKSIINFDISDTDPSREQLEMTVLRTSKTGTWIDQDLHIRLVKCSLEFCPFKNIEDYLMNASSPSLSMNKDLVYSAQISKDFKPTLHMVVYHILRVGVVHFSQQNLTDSLQLTLEASECLFLNLLILDEIMRKLYMYDKARIIEAIEVSILWMLSCIPATQANGQEEFRQGCFSIQAVNAIVECRNSLMRMVFRTYLTKLDFKISKVTNLDFFLQACESAIDKPLFGFSAELLERKYKLIEQSVGLPEALLKQMAADDSSLSQDSPPPSLFVRTSGIPGQTGSLARDLTLHIQGEVSKMYTAPDILTKLRFRENEQILVAMQIAAKLLAVNDLWRTFRLVHGKINEAILEVAFKLESNQASVETNIAQHEERYERILTYLKNKIEVSGISSESVMRSCRFAAHKVAKEQRDINGLWRAHDLPSALQVDEPFSPELYDYDTAIRNKYYDFAVENYCTAQKTRPFMRFELRRYWTDNYDDIFKDEDKDGAKSVYTALNSRSASQRKPLKKQSSSLVKQTGFFHFQAKKNKHMSRYRHRIMKIVGQNPEEIDKLFTENLEDDQVVFGKRCQLIEKFKIWQGSLYLYRDKLHFYINTFEISNYFSSHTKELKAFDKLKRMWNVSSIRDMKIRRMNQKRSAIELFFKDGYSILFNFNCSHPAEKDVTNFYQRLKSVISLSNPRLDPTKLMNFVPAKQFETMKLTERWLNGDISNFEYLMEVNLYSGRSYNDLSQYPVYPWIIMVDYINDHMTADPLAGETEEFLANLQVRDLSNNIGSIGDRARLQNYVKRYTSARYFDSHVPAYHYGSHYSTPAIVIYYLLRLFPFTEGAIDFQSGSFDIADRLFHSVQKCFKNAMEEMSDVRELIPEFFFMPELLLNVNKLNLGILHTEERVNNVELPNWTGQNPYLFVYVLKKLLEGKEVSTSLGGWIDLVFGSKQIGPEAVEKTNIFYYLTYEDQVDMDALPEEDKDAIETQVLHFGQTPSQLFVRDHPSLNEANPRFLFAINRERQKMMLYKRTKQDSQLSDPSAPVRGLWLNAAYNQKLSLSCIKGLAVDTYLWETKTAKDMTTQNSIPFRLAHQSEASFADCLLLDSIDTLDRPRFEAADAPVAFMPDKKLVVMGGFVSGSVRFLQVGQTL